MNLLTLGCSFTYGEELTDPRADCWPQQLACQLGYRLVNLGKPTNSGHGIVRQLIDHLSHEYNESPDLVVIGWPSAGRVEYSDAAGEFNIWPGYSGNLFKKHHSWREELLNYINKYHNDEYLLQGFLNNVILAQNLLAQRQIPYIMLNVVGNEYYLKTCIDNYQHLVKLINKENFIGWPAEGMLEWTEAARCPKGPNGHFLKEGHKIVANKIYEYIRDLGWVS